MQEDFHYYAAYCAAYLAGFNHEESVRIGYSDQFVDCCTETYLAKIRGQREAATTQSQPELASSRGDMVSIQNMTRIWASFHFLPYDLEATLPGHHSKKYMNKYRLICKPNSDQVVETVRIAKDKSLEHCGIAMHVLSDTWAHTYFAGTPSLVINNATEFYDINRDKPLSFSHNPTVPEDPEKDIYVNSPNLMDEISIMVLGHGRAGHLPDYSFFRYKYLPAWGNYEEIVKDNPADYYLAFGQMVTALKYLRGETQEFKKEVYDEVSVGPHKERIMAILEKRQVNACADWKAFGEELSGSEIPEFNMFQFEREFLTAADKNNTFLGRFCAGAIEQKSMIANRIYFAGSNLAGFPVDANGKRIRRKKQ